ncbi:MAG TPA: pyridoxal-dependent decarboxylase [Bryobacteraceae bacterium]|nr:pyridoxal-dependent decarboxylase [Bryobacteraceae bacterium]
MTNQEFRDYGHQVVDWIADYLENIRQYPVLAKTQPGDLIDSLPARAPEYGEGMDAILQDFEQAIVPALTHWNHPRFLAYFAISASQPGILAEMLAAALNVNGMLWKSCPALTELEQVTLGWLRQWIGLPAEFFGIIYDTASVSTLHALAAAREMADPQTRTRGNSGGLVMYTSEHAHSSVEKAAITLGIGQDNFRKIPVDDAFRMRVDALCEAIEADQLAGKKPFCIVPTVGTTSTSSIDPVNEIADVAEACGAWLHVDAAYGGAAAVAPEFQSVLHGAERADSLVVNPHKWLVTPFDLSAFYTRRPEILRQAFSLVPEYLRTAEDPRAVNYMDYGVQLGRRFRALKLWFIMRHFGREGIAEIIRTHMQYAQRLAALIRAHPDFEVAAPTPFSLICFRYRGSDEENRALLDAINASGKAFLSHTVLRGRFVLRLAIGNMFTEWEDLEEVWELIQESIRTTA